MQKLLNELRLSMKRKNALEGWKQKILEILH